MRIFEENNKIIVEDLQDFDPKHIFECGQCFRWNKEEDNSYTGVAHGKVLNVKKEENTVVFDNTSLADFHSIWYDYFDLNRDYAIIKNDLRKIDNYLAESVEFGSGIRLLNQDEWETLVSFIISANNRIPMIKRAIENLSMCYGNEIGEYKGKMHYSFPNPKKINSLSEEEIKACKTGFRAQYIKDTSFIVAHNEMDIYKYKNLNSDMCKKELLRFCGVGSKVADCIMLFSMGKYDSFPVDVWVKRVMEEFYIKEEINLNKIREYGVNKFKDLSGFAQQYLFYYAREKGVGR